ncbi:MAG: 4Fe-4S dicluster domain-containing protein [Candidatus Omnitrophica bacterium]|nr:4Fe-4S dicluster domain-containing protein [Candidatus Omnitrophota bacterium]
MNKTKKALEFKKTVSVSEFDRNFKSEIMAHPDAQGLAACFSCGTCSAGCPIHDVFPEYNPKKLAKMVRLGMRRQVLSSPYIWYCATCHNCEQRCPQNVKFFNVLNVLKNMAAKEGYAPQSWVEQTKQVIKTGIIFPTDEEWVKKREKLTLPSLKEEHQKLKKIIELTGIDKIKPKVDTE